MITSKFLSHDDLALVARSWTVNNPKAKIIFLHGLFEYAGRYTYEAEYFNKNGYDFIGYDQRTHGESGGKRRAHIDDFNKYVKDCEIFVNKMSKGNLPYFLYAHSMGGLVLTSFLLSKKHVNPNFRGVILTGPFLQVKDDMAPILQKVAGVVARLFPNLKTVGGRPNSISRDPEVVKKFINDPLVYTDGMYACTGYQMLKQSQYITSHIHRFDYPYILMHGTDDQLADIGGSENMYEKSSSDDKTYITYPDYKHEITRDIGRDEVMEDMLAWTEERLS